MEFLAQSNFSFLRGASHPQELVQTAFDLGLRGLVLADRGGVYGVARAYQQWKGLPKKENLQLIVGLELPVLNHADVVLVPKNREAYGDLCELLTTAHAQGAKGQGHVTLDQALNHLTPLGSQVLVLPRAGGVMDAYRRTVHPEFCWDLWKQAGVHLVVPIAAYLDGQDQARRRNVEELAHKWELPVLACNDVFYHAPCRQHVQDVLTCVREKISLREAGYRLFPNGERCLKSPEEMRRLFRERPEWVDLSLHLAQECQFSLSEIRYEYPSEWIPARHSAQSYLEELVHTRAPQFYSGQVPEEVQRQLRHELQLIQRLGYADYFLTIYDIVAFARSQNILCQGRGSAANSAVCFVLGITAIDPVRMNLLFERFISEERGEPPDIDVDFEHERREEVIQYIYSKYGRDRAGMVSAVVTYQRRSAFREVVKAFGVEVGSLSAKKVEKDFDQLAHSVKDVPRLREQIETIVNEIEGFPRHLTIHSGGFTLSAHPITRLVPVEPARMAGRTIVQWDKYDLDTLGLLKVDVLSLGMLSAIRKTLQSVGLELHQIPREDPATYAMIQKCDTVGVFQIESRAQMSMLGRLQPKTFYDLVVEVAIVRPGPIVGQMVHPYLKRRHGLEKVEFPDPRVREILGKTLGVPLFQEQVMKLAIDVAGFTPGEADLLRRSINAWRSSAPIAQMADRLMQGLLRAGLPKSFADQIFQQIQGFSMYGFPESHAASFALLAYASSYLKCHYPAAFVCALLNSQPMGFYRNDTLVFDAIRHGVQFFPVSFNHSQWDCTLVSPNQVRLGFRVVKGLAKNAVDQLIQERESHGPFRDHRDLVRRVAVRQDVLHRMILAGAFQELGWEPRAALWALLEYESLTGARSAQQLTFWDVPQVEERSDCSEFQHLASPMDRRTGVAGIPCLDEWGQIQEDYRAYRLSTHGHPMAELRRQSSRVPPWTSLRLRSQQQGFQRTVKIAGLLLLRQRPPTAKGVVFATLEDEYGFVDLILHKYVFDKHRDVFLQNCFLVVTGKVQKIMGLGATRSCDSVAEGPVGPLFREPKARSCDSAAGGSIGPLARELGAYSSGGGVTLLVTNVEPLAFAADHAALHLEPDQYFTG